MRRLEIYEASSAEGYDFFLSEDVDQALDAYLKMDGRSLLAEWLPHRVRMIRKEGRKKLLPSDAPSSGPNLIFTEKATKVLWPILQKYGELLPLICDDAILSIFNVTHVIDALDLKASSYSSFDDGTIMIMEEDGYVFRPEVVAGVDVFRSTGYRISPVFLGQGFVDRWAALGLRGLDFTRIWTSE